MKFEVLIHPDAERELDEAYEFIAKDSPSAAVRWREQLLRRALTLATFPKRCPVAPESAALSREVRHLVVGGYRLFFVIEAKRVTVLHIRHASRRRLGEED